MRSEEKETLILLRAQGCSYLEIASKMGKSKQTLISHAKLLHNEINEFKAIERDALQRKYLVVKEERIKAIGKLANKVMAELETRELADIGTDKLVGMALKLTATLANDHEEIVVREHENDFSVSSGFKVTI